MGKLIHLRWLDWSYTRSFSAREGLETICNELLNLETLLLRDCALEQIPRGIGNLIRLRHLNLSTNKYLKELPREIGNLIRLRRLYLGENKSIKELPREIGNLVELRYLYLGDNKSLKELPENICDMCELEILDINYCNNLSKLPQGIHRLVNLKHLHNRKTPSLKQFPQGIAQLTCLRTLREFRVGRDMGKLGWLKDLNRLGGKLSLVINLTGNMDVEDAREGELRNKKYLVRLDMQFDYKMDIGVEDCVWMDVIDTLEPHPNLQILIIVFFHGSRLPGWIASPLNQIKTIFLKVFSHLSSILLPLGKLPCLEVIEITVMPELRFVGREFLGGGITTTTETTTTIVVFPKLRRLTFQYCPKWEEWEDNINDQEEEGNDEKAISFMPRLTNLEIRNCSSLAALPHCLLRKVASSSLDGSMNLDISGSTQLEQLYGDREGSPWKSISHINPRIQLII